LLLAVLLLDNLRLRLGQDLGGEHADQAELVFLMGTGNDSDLLDFTLEKVLAVDPVVVAIVDYPGQYVVTRVSLAMPILDGLEDGTTPHGVLLDPIFVGTLAVGGFVLRQSLRCDILIMIKGSLMQKLVHAQRLQHAWVAHKELERVR